MSRCFPAKVADLRWKVCGPIGSGQRPVWIADAFNSAPQASIAITLAPAIESPIRRAAFVLLEVRCTDARRCMAIVHLLASRLVEDDRIKLSTPWSGGANEWKVEGDPAAALEAVADALGVDRDHLSWRL